MAMIRGTKSEDVIKVLEMIHVQKLFYEAIDELRITYRWLARDLENDEIQRRKSNI